MAFLIGENENYYYNYAFGLFPKKEEKFAYVLDKTRLNTLSKLYIINIVVFLFLTVLGIYKSFENYSNNETSSIPILCIFLEFLLFSYSIILGINFPPVKIQVKKYKKENKVSLILYFYFCSYFLSNLLILLFSYSNKSRSLPFFVDFIVFFVCILGLFCFFYSFYMFLFWKDEK